MSFINWKAHWNTGIIHFISLALFYVIFCTISGMEGNMINDFLSYRVLWIPGHSATQLPDPSANSSMPEGQKHPATHWKVQKAGWLGAHVGGQADPQSRQTLPLLHDVSACTEKETVIHVRCLIFASLHVQPGHSKSCTAGGHNCIHSPESNLQSTVTQQIWNVSQ